MKIIVLLALLVVASVMARRALYHKMYQDAGARALYHYRSGGAKSLSANSLLLTEPWDGYSGPKTNPINKCELCQDRCDADPTKCNCIKRVCK
jgi:hypothetical protein